MYKGLIISHDDKIKREVASLLNNVGEITGVFIDWISVFAKRPADHFPGFTLVKKPAGQFKVSSLFDAITCKSQIIIYLGVYCLLPKKECFFIWINVNLTSDTTY